MASHRGLSYSLFLPAGRPHAGVVISHGAGSCKENHFDFARLLQQAGHAALCFDARGHGESAGAFGPAAVEDVLEMAELLRCHADQIALRGSSLGGFLAIQAATRDPSIAAVVAICPAPQHLLLRGLQSPELDFSVQMDQTRRWLQSASLPADAADLGYQTALLLCHAAGDERIPVSLSRDLYSLAGPNKRLIVSGGGTHRSLQHDRSIQLQAIEFISEMADRRRRILAMRSTGNGAPENVEVGRSAI